MSLRKAYLSTQLAMYAQCTNQIGAASVHLERASRLISQLVDTEEALRLWIVFGSIATLPIPPPMHESNKDEPHDEESEAPFTVHFSPPSPSPTLYAFAQQHLWSNTTRCSAVDASGNLHFRATHHLNTYRWKSPGQLPLLKEIILWASDALRCGVLTTLSMTLMGTELHHMSQTVESNQALL